MASLSENVKIKEKKKLRSEGTLKRILLEIYFSFMKVNDGIWVYIFGAIL